MPVTLRDRLSHLAVAHAHKLLGPRGKQLLVQGGALDLDGLVIDEREARARVGTVVARIVHDPRVAGHLRAVCSACQGPCLHVAGLLSLLLEQKTDLGLAAPPPDAAYATSAEELVRQALAERAERAKKERMKIRGLDPRAPWTDYTVTNTVSGKTYRVALRGTARGVSYCSCPDFKTNTLGTCKHVMKVLAHAEASFPKSVRAKPYRRKRITVHLRYAEDVSLALALPDRLPDDARAIVLPLLSRPIDARDLVRRLRKLETGNHAFFVTPDAEEHIERQLLAARLASLVSEIRSAPASHPLRSTLLKEPLLPYQLDGVAFVAGAGRAILADEMGLGKTIQAVGLAELLAREVGIQKVLVVCPASLKAQWRGEIQRFSHRSVLVVAGPSADRAGAYAGDAFFTVCNYEQVLKDILHIEKTRWDLIVLDEGQRIKNWEAKTSRVVKGLRSRFALVLTGTPLENRLDDLHSVAAFVDPHQLGPSFRFLHRHQRKDEKGALLGFKEMAALRERLRPILLRRTRASVRLELPPRVVEIVRVAPTDEQKELHDAHLRTVAQIVRKPFLTEMDLLRLRVALLMCRMAADGTVLVDKTPPGHSSKLERLAELFDVIAEEPDRKVVVFSEWTTMLDLIEPLLRRRKLGFVRLDGGVPQGKRQQLVAAFRDDARVRFFLTTNAGSTGLNLQAANTIVNVDLPWNPAVLEQRIARAHRMGQRRPVSVYVFVTEQTLEENLLTTLASKRDLALAALDPESDVDEVAVRSQSADLKAKLEVLLGNKPEAPIDETAKAAASGATAPLASTGNAFVGAMVDLVAAAMGGGAPERAALEEVRAGLDVKLARDEHGSARISFAVPPRELLARAFRGLAQVLEGSRSQDPRGDQAGRG